MNSVFPNSRTAAYCQYLRNVYGSVTMEVEIIQAHKSIALSYNQLNVLKNNHQKLEYEE